MKVAEPGILFARESMAANDIACSDFTCVHGHDVVFHLELVFTKTDLSNVLRESYKSCE